MLRVSSYSCVISIRSYHHHHRQQQWALRLLPHFEAQQEHSSTTAEESTRTQRSDPLATRLSQERNHNNEPLCPPVRSLGSLMRAAAAPPSTPPHLSSKSRTNGSKRSIASSSTSPTLSLTKGPGSSTQPTFESRDRLAAEKEAKKLRRLTNALLSESLSSSPYSIGNANEWSDAAREIPSPGIEFHQRLENALLLYAPRLPPPSAIGGSTAALQWMLQQAAAEVYFEWLVRYGRAPTNRTAWQWLLQRLTGTHHHHHKALLMESGSSASSSSTLPSSTPLPLTSWLLSPTHSPHIHASWEKSLALLQWAVTFSSSTSSTIERNSSVAAKHPLPLAVGDVVSVARAVTKAFGEKTQQHLPDDRSKTNAISSPPDEHAMTLTRLLHWLSLVASSCKPQRHPKDQSDGEGDEECDSSEGRPALSAATTIRFTAEGDRLLIERAVDKHGASSAAPTSSITRSSTRSLLLEEESDGEIGGGSAASTSAVYFHLATELLMQGREEHIIAEYDAQLRQTTTTLTSDALPYQALLRRSYLRRARDSSDGRTSPGSSSMTMASDSSGMAKLVPASLIRVEGRAPLRGGRDRRLLYVPRCDVLEQYGFALMAAAVKGAFAAHQQLPSVDAASDSTSPFRRDSRGDSWEDLERLRSNMVGTALFGEVDGAVAHQRNRSSSSAAIEAIWCSQYQSCGELLVQHATSLLSLCFGAQASRHHTLQPPSPSSSNRVVGDGPDFTLALHREAVRRMLRPAWITLPVLERLEQEAEHSFLQDNELPAEGKESNAEGSASMDPQSSVSGLQQSFMHSMGSMDNYRLSLWLEAIALVGPPEFLFCALRYLVAENGLNLKLVLSTEAAAAIATCCALWSVDRTGRQQHQEVRGEATSTTSSPSSISFRSVCSAFENRICFLSIPAVHPSGPGAVFQSLSDPSFYSFRTTIGASKEGEETDYHPHHPSSRQALWMLSGRAKRVVTHFPMTTTIPQRTGASQRNNNRFSSAESLSNHGEHMNYSAPLTKQQQEHHHPQQEEWLLLQEGQLWTLHLDQVATHFAMATSSASLPSPLPTSSSSLKSLPERRPCAIPYRAFGGTLRFLYKPAGVYSTLHSGAPSLVTSVLAWRRATASTTTMAPELTLHDVGSGVHHRWRLMDLYGVSTLAQLRLLNRLDVGTSGIVLAAAAAAVTSAPSDPTVEDASVTLDGASADRGGMVVCRSPLSAYRDLVIRGSGRTVAKYYRALLVHRPPSNQELSARHCRVLTSSGESQTLSPIVEPGSGWVFLPPRGTIGGDVAAFGGRGDGATAAKRMKWHHRNHATVDASSFGVTQKDDQRRASTSYRVLESFPWQGIYLVEALLHSGRRHQIRQHFASIHHPLLGDERYDPLLVSAAGGGGGGSRSGIPPSLAAEGGFALHACRVVVESVEHGKKVSVECAVPEYFERALEELRQEEERRGRYKR